MWLIACGQKSEEPADPQGADSGNPAVDADGDGWTGLDGDCDDADPTVYPDADETCDDKDNDCDDEVDEDVMTTYYRDADGDGFGDADVTTEACDVPSGYVGIDLDCDDTTAEAFPGNAEVCDELDNDCDDEVDEGVAETYYADLDGDGYGDSASTMEACEQPTDYVTDDTDIWYCLGHGAHRSAYQIVRIVGLLGLVGL